MNTPFQNGAEAMRRAIIYTLRERARSAATDYVKYVVAADIELVRSVPWPVMLEEPAIPDPVCAQCGCATDVDGICVSQPRHTKDKQARRERREYWNDLKPYARFGLAALIYVFRPPVNVTAATCYDRADDFIKLLEQDL